MVRSPPASKPMRFLPVIVAFSCVRLSVAVAAPEGYWSFEETPGFLADASPNGRTLTNSGVTALPSGGPGAGQAALFAGAQRMMVPDSAVWSSARFTIEAYFRPTGVSTGATQVIACHHNNTSNQRGWHLAEAGSKLRFAKSINGSTLDSVDSFTLVAGHDYYAAAIFDGVTGRVRMVLKDRTAGTPVESELRTIATGTYDANSPFAIGSTGTETGGSSFFKGAIDNVRFTAAALPTEELQEPFVAPPDSSDPPPVADRTKANGYKGIWFELGQKSEYGDKYSGGLGTYTVNHAPLAIYSPVANKTFFTYGGTSGPLDRRLLIMAAEYDHGTHTVTKPTVVMDKTPVNDPHDNACISLDNEGYVWVFVSGRNTARKGFTYRSAEKYSTDGFIRISPESGESYTYPQVWHDPVKGFMHLLTRYNGGQRELFFRTSPDGLAWSEVKPFAQIQGHYQVSARNGDVVATFFNRHPGGNVDKRTDLYYMQTADFGQTWTNAAGTVLTLPLNTTVNPARVVDYASQNRLMYGVDLTFDEAGHPVLLYVTSSSYLPGPAGEPRTMHTARWTGSEWVIRNFPPSATPVSTVTHNYAAGSIWITGGTWKVIAPTGSQEALRTSYPNRFWGAGGEVELWTSTDQGQTWTKDRAVTENSARNHDYIRKALNGTGRFVTFWGDGNPAAFSESHLYFGNAEGTRFWELPYDMTAPTAKPVEVNPPFLRWQRSKFSPSQLADPLISGPDADPDGDGQNNLAEYAQGTRPLEDGDHGSLTAQVMEDGIGKFCCLHYRRSSETFDLFHKIEASGNLTDWQDIESELFDMSSTGNGSLLDVTRGHRRSGGLPDQRFYRMRYEFDK